MSIASQEIRERAIGAYRAGKGRQADVADMFGISLRTFERWWKAYRNEGRTAPLPRGHNPPALDEQAMQRLDALVAERPDRTLAQLREALSVSCSLVAIHYALRRLDWRYKKNRYARANSTAPM